MTPAGARCGVHAEVAAVDVCKRCGKFLCGACLELLGEDPYCADCSKLAEKPMAPSTLLPLGLSVASWVSFAAAYGARNFVLAIGTQLLSVLAFAAAVTVAIRMRIGMQSAKGKWFVAAAFLLTVPLMLFLALVTLRALE